MIAILEYVWNALGKALAFLASVPGMITGAVAGFAAFLGGIFADAFDLSGVASLISQMSSWLGQLSQIDTSQGISQLMIYCTGIDTLCSDAIITVAATVGMTVLLFVGSFTAILAVLVAALAVRGLLKLIRVASAGFVAPVVVLLLLPLSSFADLEVQRPSPNVVVVSGTGNGDYPQVVITNVIGYCTNCVAVTPAQLREFKDEVYGFLDSIKGNVDSCMMDLDYMRHNIDSRNDDVATFYHVDGPINSTPTFDALTNYTLRTQNQQSDLVNHATFTLTSGTSYNIFNAVSIAARYAFNGYANGIYDYAHAQDYAWSDLDSSERNIRMQLDWVSQDADLASAAVLSLSEDACNNIEYVPGSLPSDGSTTNVPGIGKEQLDALLDYVKHIDSDCHDLLADLKGGTNDLARLRTSFESYAQVLGSALFQGSGTIVTDDAGNSWSNVYNSGESQLYDYNRSNVLQRIELLLYGISGIAPTEGTDSDFDSVENDYSSVDASIQEMDRVAAEGAAKAGRTIEQLGDAFSSFFSASSFLGSGSVQYQYTGSYSIEFGGQRYDVAGLSLEEENKSFLETASSISRICFQLLWHFSALVLVFFYYRWFLLVAFRFVKWGGEIINSVFGS